MIRSDSEFRNACRRIEAERKSLSDHEAKLRAMGLSEDQISAGMAPLVTIHMQFAEEVEQYARIRNKDLSAFDSLRDIGRILIGARIASNMSGRALANKLGVNESQVSRDERNEYSGITVDRACEILEAMDVEVKIQCEMRSVSRESKRVSRTHGHTGESMRRIPC
jgi:hypothetical protein